MWLFKKPPETQSEPPISEADIGITGEALDFENKFISRLRDSILDVAVEVADIRGEKTIDAADFRHVLRHAFERAMRGM